jgi:hypothetical protein
MRSLTKAFVSFGAAVLGLAVAANAVPWSNPSGTVPGVFSWSNGQSDNGLFGSPIVAGTSFTFFPSNFRATSNNGVAATTTDRLSFQIDVAPGAPDLLGIVVTELGDYSITNGGTVSAETFLFVTNLDIPVNPPSNPLVQQASTNPNFPLVVAQPGNANGTWVASASQPLPGGWRRLTIILNNVLQAATPQGGAATIEKKVGGIRIDVPEPGTISLALMSLGGLMIRRRK